MSVSYRRGDKFKVSLSGLYLAGLNSSDYKLVLTGSGGESSTSFASAKKDSSIRYKKKNAAKWNEPLTQIITITKDGRCKHQIRIDVIEKSRNREKNFGRVEFDLGAYVGANVSKKEEMHLKKDKNTLFKMHITSQPATSARQTSPSFDRGPPLERKYSESASRSTTRKNTELKAELAKKDREIQQLKETLRHLQEEEKAGSGNDVARARLEKEIANLQGQVDGASAGDDAQLQENERLKVQLQQLRQQYDTDVQEVELLRDQKSLNSGDIVQKMKRQLEDLSKQQTTLQQELQHRESRVTELQQQLSSIKGQEHDQNSQKFEDTSQIEDVQMSLAEKRNTYDRQKQQIERLEQQSSSAAAIRESDEGSMEIRIKELEEQIKIDEREQEKLTEENERLDSKVKKLQGDSKSYSEKISHRRREAEQTPNDPEEKKAHVNYEQTSARVAADAKAQSEIRHGQSELQMIQNAYRLEKENRKTIRNDLDSALRNVSDLNYQVQQLQRGHEQLVGEKNSQGSHRKNLQTSLRHRIVEAEREARSYRAETQRSQMKIRHLQQQLYLAQDQAKFGSLLQKNKRRGLKSYQPPSIQNSFTRNKKSRTTALLEALLMDIDAEKASLRKNGYRPSPTSYQEDDYESKHDGPLPTANGIVDSPKSVVSGTDALSSVDNFEDEVFHHSDGDD